MKTIDELILIGTEEYFKPRGHVANVVRVVVAAIDASREEAPSVEELAKALYEARIYLDGKRKPAWEHLVETQDSCRAEARVAIDMCAGIAQAETATELEQDGAKARWDMIARHNALGVQLDGSDYDVDLWSRSLTGERYQIVKNHVDNLQERMDRQEAPSVEEVAKALHAKWCAAWGISSSWDKESLQSQKGYRAEAQCAIDMCAGTVRTETADKPPATIDRMGLVTDDLLGTTSIIRNGHYITDKAVVQDYNLLCGEVEQLRADLLRVGRERDVLLEAEKEYLRLINIKRTPARLDVTADELRIKRDDLDDRDTTDLEDLQDLLCWLNTKIVGTVQADYAPPAGLTLEGLARIIHTTRYRSEVWEEQSEEHKKRWVASASATLTALNITLPVESTITLTGPQTKAQLLAAAEGMDA